MTTEASIGVNLRVTAHSNQGGRKYMEDMFCVAYQPTADERDLLYAYFGIFDGHGGRDAALYAKQHLMDQIVCQRNFWSQDDKLVLRAIRDGFVNTHYAMWKELEKWPKTPSGLPSTSGTTASIAFVRRGKIYIGHVGDSGIVLGHEDPATGFWRARPLTKDHKPESMAENARITQSGGKVISKSGVPRVVWNRPRIGHKGPVRRSTLIDEIPFLAVARSLGDLWSYNSTQNEFIVSPEPDVSVVEIDVCSHRCLILGSDGLWNMLNAQEAVNSVCFSEKNNEKVMRESSNEVPQSCSWINPSKRLVDRALERWYNHNLRADNTSVVTVVIDPPGPPRSHANRQHRNSGTIVHSSKTTGVKDPTGSKKVPALLIGPGNKIAPNLGLTAVAVSSSQFLPHPSLQPRPSTSFSSPRILESKKAPEFPSAIPSLLRSPIKIGDGAVSAKPGPLLPSQPPNQLAHVGKMKRKRHASGLASEAAVKKTRSSDGTTDLPRDPRPLRNREDPRETPPTTSKDADVQIHEISSSSEFSRLEESTMIRDTEETKNKKSKKDELATSRPRKRKILEISSRSPRLPSPKRSKNKLSCIRLSSALLKKKSIQSLKTIVPSAKENKVKKIIVKRKPFRENVSNQATPSRNLRSKSKETVRVTRSKSLRKK